MTTERRREYRRKYYQENRERFKEQAKQHYLTNKEKVLERTKRYRESHREQENAYRKEYKRRNREKYKQYNRDWEDRNPEWRKNYEREYRKRHPNIRRKSMYKMRYGITLDEYETMLQRQNGVCAICKNGSLCYLTVDHDHATGMVRGLLCKSCNTMLGLAGDSVLILKSAEAYLGEADKEKFEETE